MPLTELRVRNAKPDKKAYRLKDERGLYLEVAPSGGKWWRFRYWWSWNQIRTPRRGSTGAAVEATGRS